MFSWQHLEHQADEVGVELEDRHLAMLVHHRLSAKVRKLALVQVHLALVATWNKDVLDSKNNSQVIKGQDISGLPAVGAHPSACWSRRAARRAWPAAQGRSS